MAMEPPPLWFFEVYDSMETGIPLYPAPTVRQYPLYLRYRMRLVRELMKEAKIQSALKAKAMGVIDLSNI